MVAVLGLSGAAGGHAAQPDSTFRLVLHVPAYRLDVHAGAALERSFTVAVGTRDHRTPLGRFAVRSITWNPWWYPPPFEWAATDTVTPPCPENPVGRVKLNFSTFHYLHGTPAPRSLGHAASHGCVRLAQDDALALAARVVAATLPESAAVAAAYAAGRDTRTLRLPRPAPLEIRYTLAEVRADTLWLYPDVYRRASAQRTRLALARAALAAAGRDTLAVPPDTLRAAIARSRRTRTGVPLRP